MKKRVKDKKKVVGAIGIVTAAVCCLGVASATNVTGDSLSGAKLVEVYAEDTSVANETYQAQWDSAISTLKSIDDLSVRNNYVDYLFAYLNASDAYPMISGSVTPEDQQVYEEAGTLIRKDAECYRYFANSLSVIYKNQNIGWADKEDYDANLTYFNSLDTMKQDVIKEGALKFDEMCTYADTEFGRIQTAMDGVITAINDIYYVDGNIVVNSKTSLDNVASAIKAIYNKEYSEIADEEVKAIATYVTNLNKYDQAVIDYNAILTECELMDTRIVATYEAFTTETGEYYNKHYTQKTVITSLRTDFNALNRADDDNATTLCTEEEKLKELEKALSDIETAKAEVESLIAEIDDTFDYTDAYIAEVNSAKTAFDNLPDDLKAIAGDLVAEGSTETEVKDYKKLTTALEDIKVCSDEVDALIERAKNLEVLYNEGSASFSNEVNGVTQALLKMEYAKQKADFNLECGEILADMQTKQENLSAQISSFIDAVQAIGEVKLSNSEIGNQIENAYIEYAKLTETIQQNAVLGYKNTLDAKKAKLDELMAEANDWKASVEAIILGGKITTANIADITDVEDELDAIEIANLDMYNVITGSGDLYGYSKFTTLTTARDDLLTSISNLANDMSNLLTDLPSIVADPSTFNGAVESATDRFNALDDTVKAEYFTEDTATNKTAYTNYVSALNIYNAVAKLAGNIAGLYDLTEVNMADYLDIVDYNAEYEALSADNKTMLETEKVNNDKTFKAVLDEATAKVNDLKQARDTWTKDVYALVGGIEKANWETELYSVDLTKVATLKQERVDLDNTDNGLDEVDVDLTTIEQIGNKRVDDLNDKIDELENKAELEKSDVATLESIYDIYNNKLDQTQKDKVKYSVFEVLYNKYVFAQNFDEAVLALYEDVITNGNYTSQVPVTVGLLRSIYINFGSEMKALIQEYSKIDEIENEYNAHAEQEGGILNLTGVYNDLMTKIDANGDNLSDVIDNLTALTDRITQLKNDLDALEQIVGVVDGDKTLSEQIAELKQGLADAKAELGQADSDISDKLTKLETSLTTLVGQTKSELEGKITQLKSELEDAISALEDTLKQADEDNKTELEGKITQLKGELEDAISTLENTLKQADTNIIADIAKVREELADAETRLNDALDVVKTELENKITELKGDLEDAISALENTLKEADETNKTELEGKITQLKGELETTISTLENTLKQADTNIIADIAKVREELTDAETRLNNALNAVKSELENLIAENKAELKAEIESLRETLTLITIVLSIVSGLSLLGVIVLFVRKRR